MSYGKSEIASDFFHLNTGSEGKTYQGGGWLCCLWIFLSGDVPSRKKQSYKLFMTEIRFCSHSTLYQHLLKEKEQQNFLFYILF